MDLYELAKETKELKEEIKREERTFKSKIEPKVKECRTKEEAIKNYLREALKEYEYRKLKVEPINKWFKLREHDGKITILYPFIKIKDIYVMEYESFEIKKIPDYDYEWIYRSYALRNKENGKLIEVEERAILDIFILSLSFEINIEGMEVIVGRDFDRSKLRSMNEIKSYKTS